MYCEIFFRDDVKDIIFDPEVQTSYLTQAKNEQKKLIPFLPLKKTMQEVFSVLCPVKVKESDYPYMVPKQALDAISFAETLPWIEKVEIWYDDITPDPVAIATEIAWYIDIDGKKQDGHGPFKSKAEAEQFIMEHKLQNAKPYHYGWSAHKYIIAKWGDEEKYDFEQLKQRAKERFIAQEKARLIKEKARIEAELLSVEAEAILKFGA